MKSDDALIERIRNAIEFYGYEICGVEKVE